MRLESTASNLDELPVRFCIGDWLIDGDSLTAQHDGVVRALEPLALKVLRYLAERPAKLVSVDELMDACWGSAIVTPNAVARVIARIRQTLDDNAKNPLHIETVSRSGYRLISPVSVKTTSDSGRSIPVRSVAMAIGLAALVVVVYWAISRPPESTAPTIAVLPLQNFTVDPNNDYLGHGLMEEMISALASSAEFKVIARSLSSNYAADTMDATRFARQLGVDYYVEGSIRMDGPTLRLTAQLIRADSGFHVWARVLDTPRTGVFSAQDLIAKELKQAFAEETGAQISAPIETTSQPVPEAYDLYLRGRYIWHRRGSEPLQRSLNLLAEAVRIDPDFARGWAALASAYSTLPSYSPDGFGSWHLAEDAAKRANELDPALAEPYAVLAEFAQRRGDWLQAEALYQQSLERDANSPTIHHWYAEFLRDVGRIEDGYAHTLRALELDPLYLPSHADVAWTELHYGDAGQAADEFASLWERGFRGPECWAGNFFSNIVAARFDRAREWIELAPSGENNNGILEAFVDAAANDTDLAATDLEFAIRPGAGPDHRTIVWILSVLGERDALLDFLIARLDRGAFVYSQLLFNVDELLLRDARFHTILQMLGLVDFWETSGYGDVCRPGAPGLLCNHSIQPR